MMIALTCLMAVASVVLAADPPVEGVTVEPTPQTKPVAETAEQRDARMAWWREAKFGLFIHWGVYAVPAGKWGERDTHGEWIMHSAKIPVATYRDLAQRFNPVKYDAVEWVRVAEEAGMRYIVITSKHHDGFALYPSDVTDWDIADATPYKKDLLGPLVAAAKARGLRIGFYYSQSQDWVHPGGAKSGFKEGEGWDDAHKGSYDDYLQRIAIPQAREILSRYPIDILWWDTPMHMSKERATPLHDLLALRPGIISNNRLGSFPGDTATPEQFIPVTGYPGDWETCMTLNGHWGYNAADVRWKSSTDLIRKLAEICGKGGNFLLNVGPTADGEFPPACVERLREVGAWLRVNGEAIYGTKAGPFKYLSYGFATRKGNQLFLHVLKWPSDGTLEVPLQNNAKQAYLLASPEQKLAVTRESNRLAIAVPTAAPDPANTVVVLELDAEPVVAPLPTLGAKVTASATLEGNPAENAIDGTGAKRWRAPKDVKSASIEVTLEEPSTIAAFGIDEPDVWPRMKQSYKLEAKVGDDWQTIATGKTNGHGAVAAIKPVTAQLFRLTMDCEAGSPGVAEFQLYRPE
jgi:alpha-L-fucosidase